MKKNNKKKIKKKIDYFEENHPDWYFHVENMTTLILGTYPPHISKWNYEFYYSNYVNTTSYTELQIKFVRYLNIFFIIFIENLYSITYFI